MCYIAVIEEKLIGVSWGVCMKKIIILLLVVLSFGCSIYDVASDLVYTARIKKAEIYYLEEFYSLHSIEAIQWYINKNIKYKADEGDI